MSSRRGPGLRFHHSSRGAALGLGLGLGLGLVACLGLGCAPTAPAASPADVAPEQVTPPPPPPLRPLTVDEEKLRADLQSEMSQLAELGPRSLVHSWNLASATDHLARKLEVLGYEVSRQGFPVGEEVLQNLEVGLPGTRSIEAVVVAAHYDTTAESLGANASGSGAVVLLELAKALVGQRFARGVRLVWLSNESSGQGLPGSAPYAQHAQRGRVPVVATLTLGSLGNYSLEPGSQRYPDELLFGSEGRTSFGNFLALVSNAASNGLLEHVRPLLSTASLPVEELVLPEQSPLAADGPQARFWSAGLSGLMLTDTAQFRSPFPEGTGDTPDKLDFDRLTRVTRLLGTLVAGLAGAPDQAPAALPGRLEVPGAVGAPGAPTPSPAPPGASTPGAPGAPGELMPELPPMPTPSKVPTPQG